MKQEDWDQLNWFDKIVERFLERVHTGAKKIKLSAKLKETADQAAEKQAWIDELMKDGQAQEWETLEHTIDGHKVKNAESNIQWFNDQWWHYNHGQSSEGEAYFEIVGEYNSAGIPTGKIRVYRLIGSKELWRMRAKIGR